MSNPKGRPKGYRLSAESIAKISKTKTGFKHTEETKERISNGVSEYFDNNPTPSMLEKDSRLMCMGKSGVSRALNLMNFWHQNIELRQMMSDRMRVWHATKKSIGELTTCVNSL